MMSSSSSSTFRQELPPPGGYQSIPFKRIEAKKLFKSRPLIAGYILMTGTATYLYKLNQAKMVRLETESRSGRLAIQPMIQAERDRMYLAQLRRNREYEENLMKDYPGWVVGTYFGEPIYRTRPADEWHDVHIAEFYGHTDNSEHSHHVQVPIYR